MRFLVMGNKMIAVAAMREVAAERGVPILDLNRYAEENLPKMGFKEKDNA